MRIRLVNFIPERRSISFRTQATGWSQVTIGSGNNSLSGYMMTAYLSADASSVTDATLYMEVTSPYGTQSIIVRSEPSNSYDAVAALVVGDSVRVIGQAAVITMCC